MYYVTYSEYYPIYEPAEGGYYYEGKQVCLTHKCQTFRKARQKLLKWFKESQSYEDGVLWLTIDHKSFGKYGKYIGSGWIVELTREPVKEYGWEPYC